MMFVTVHYCGYRMKQHLGCRCHGLFNLLHDPKQSNLSPLILVLPPDRSTGVDHLLNTFNGPILPTWYSCHNLYVPSWGKDVYRLKVTQHASHIATGVERAHSETLLKNF
jgi:hypothetical protein